MMWNLGTHRKWHLLSKSARLQSSTTGRSTRLTLLPVGLGKERSRMTSWLATDAGVQPIGEPGAPDGSLFRPAEIESLLLLTPLTLAIFGRDSLAHMPPESSRPPSP